MGNYLDLQFEHVNFEMPFNYPNGGIPIHMSLEFWEEGLGRGLG